MASKKTRTAQNRRDRRKAKQSDFTRGPKSKPKVVGHGPAGTVRLHWTPPEATKTKKSPKNSSKTPKKTQKSVKPDFKWPESPDHTPKNFPNGGKTCASPSL